MDSIPQQLLQKLELCGLTRSEARGIVLEIEKWFHASGPEWTVQHLKLIKQTILSIKADFPSGISPYVKTRNHRLVGPFRALQRLLERGDKRALQALMVYTNFVSKDLTEAQRTKFIDAVNSDEPDYWYEFDPKTIEYLVSKASNVHVENLGESYDNSHNWSDSKYAPILGGGTGLESDKASQLNHFIHSDVYRTIYNSNGQLLPEDSSWFQDTVLRSFWPKPKGRGPIGRISILQEPGFKARFIANPNRIIQHALTPIGDFSFKLLRNLPWDCTFDQQKAQRSIQEHLSSGKRAFCFDLSNATDHFPLRTQVELLYSILSSGRRDQMEIDLGASQLRIFSEVARSTWTFGSETLSWSRGQPLGLYPSFAMFALAHGVLLYDLANKLPHTDVRGGFKVEVVRPFFVVGDDVIILDDDLAHLYQQTMEDLGIPISKSKSIASDILAEFVGEVITHDYIFKPVKWRQVSTKSFSDFIKIWGYEAIPLLPRHLRAVAYAYAEAPEPVGLGINPKGKSLNERMDLLMDLFLDTFVPPLERARDEQESFRSLYKFMSESSWLIDETPHSVYEVSFIPRFGRPAQPKIDLLTELAFHEFLSDEDITEYVRYLVKKGTLQVESIKSFSDIDISGEQPSHPDTLFRKFQSMLSGK